MTKRARDAMHADLVIAHWHEPVGTALARLDTAAPAVLVVDGDRVVAAVARDRLADWATAPEGTTPVHLRDRVSPPVWFCGENDDITMARAALERAETGAIAVVDDRQRVVGVLTHGMLPAAAAATDATAPADATDRGQQRHPGLEVYAPWATVEP